MLFRSLRPGLDESSRYLTEARVELLDPARRQQVDSELKAQANEQAVIEFHKNLTFALADGVLTPEEEAGIEAALESYRQGRVVHAKRARQIIDGQQRLTG